MLFLNRKEIDIEKFYGGELTAIVGIPNDTLHYTITWLWDDKYGANELFIIQALMETLYNKGITASLHMPYVPYARNDIEDDVVDTIDKTPRYRVDTLSALIKTINSMNFKEVIIAEPHSAVTSRGIDRCSNRHVSKLLIRKCLEDNGMKMDSVLFVLPDAGATKRYLHQLKLEENGLNWISATKQRNSFGGGLQTYGFTGNVDNFDNVDVAIIIDDICGRGGTFIPLAETLREKGVENINLVVTHCENNVHTGDVLKGNPIKKVYTTDSILTVPHENLVIAHSFKPQSNGG